MVTFLIASLVASAQGQDIAAEDDLLFADIPVVIGASKHEQRVSEAPASVTIVTAEQISRFGWRTVGEVLDSVRGMYMTRDRNYAYTGMRGFSPPGSYSERILILLDGFRVNDPLYDQGSVDYTLPIDVADIDRIEIIRGPGSSLYGTNAVLGVVNIITRKGRDLGSGEVAVVGGSYNSLGGRTSWGTRFDSDLEVLVSAGGRWSEGQDLEYKYFDRPLRNDGLSEDLDAEWDLDTLAKVGFRDIQFEAFYGVREKEIPTAAWGTYFNGQRSFTNESIGGFSTALDRVTGSGTEIHAALRLQRAAYFGDYMYNWGSPENPRLIANDDQSHTMAWFAESHVVESLFEGNQLTAGFEFRHVFMEHQYVADRLPSGPEVYLDRDGTGANIGLYLQDEWQLLPAVGVSGGVRADVYPDFGLTVNPRAAVLLDPTETTTLKLLYGTAFRAPNGYERFYEDGGIYSKAPKSLDPEGFVTAEAVIEQGLGKTWSATTTGYYTEMKDLVAARVDQRDGLAVFDNLDSVRNIGGELGAEGHPKWLEMRSSVSVHSVRDLKTERLLHNAPQLLGKAMASPALIPEHLFLGAEVLAVGKRTNPGGATLGSYAVVNTHLLGRDLVEGLELALTVRNLLGTEYRHVGGLEIRQPGVIQDGRNFRATVSYEF